MALAPVQHLLLKLLALSKRRKRANEGDGEVWPAKYANGKVGRGRILHEETEVTEEDAPSQGLWRADDDERDSAGRKFITEAREANEGDGEVRPANGPSVAKPMEGGR